MTDFSFAWTGRDDTPAEGARATRWHQHVRRFDHTQVDGVALVGFCSDEGVRRNGGRVGADEGPSAIRRALSGLAWHVPNQVSDAGDVRCANGDLEGAQAALGASVAAVLDRGVTPILLGGGHEIAWGTWQGIAADSSRTKNIGIINLDAHFDLRRSAQAHSGTPFAQIADDCVARNIAFHYLCAGASALSNTEALFATARSTGSRWILDEDFVPSRATVLAAQIDAWIAARDRIYLSICLDAFPASVAPGVSAPAARGIETMMAEWLIDRVLGSGKLLVAEFAELNPRLDDADRTAKLAARLLARCAGSLAPRG